VQPVRLRAVDAGSGGDQEAPQAANRWGKQPVAGTAQVSGSVPPERARPRREDPEADAPIVRLDQVELVRGPRLEMKRV
jgi:hypothetical protein